MPYMGLCGRGKGVSRATLTGGVAAITPYMGVCKWKKRGVSATTSDMGMTRAGVPASMHLVIYDPNAKYSENPSLKGSQNFPHQNRLHMYLLASK